MLSAETQAALKEWAVVCRALADGRQSLLVRKGGIEEIKGGFQVAHREFWLFPTFVHQKVEDLVPAVHAECEAVQRNRPPAGAIPIQLYATVTDAVRVTDLERLRPLAPHHILSWDCVAGRFQYRNKPGVHVLILRVFRRPEPVLIANTPHYDGCVSWVDLAEPVPTAGCVPVLTDADFEARLARIRACLAGAKEVS
jgi:hypothetical protein